MTSHPRTSLSSSEQRLHLEWCHSPLRLWRAVQILGTFAIWVIGWFGWVVHAADESRGSAIDKLVEEVNRASLRRDIVVEIRARMTLAEAYQLSGHYCAATDESEIARGLAESQSDRTLRLRARSTLAMIDLGARRFERSESLIRACLLDAVELGEQEQRASLLAALGTLTLLKPGATTLESATGARGMVPLRPKASRATNAALVETRRLFDEALGVAERVGDVLLSSRIRLGRATVELRHGEVVTAREFGLGAWRMLAEIGPSAARDTQWMQCARFFSELSLKNGESRDATGELEAVIDRICADIQRRESAAELEARIYALGIEGEMRRRRGELEMAMNRTLQALELSQSAGLEEARFEWTWQAARILKAMGRTAKAEAAYDLAIEILQPLRADFLSSLAGPAGSGLARESVSDIYYERADMLFEAARTVNSPEARQRSLEHARRMLERLRATDLENFYLDDDCASLVRQNESTLDAVQPGTAIVYLLALSNRTEILVRFSTGLRSFVSPVDANQLRTAAVDFRKALSVVQPETARELGRRFYRWIIEPMAAALDEQAIQTLVFVPDRQLASVPPSAFLGPDGFLVEQFAIAISPGLSLMKSGSLSRARMKPLLCGVSEGATGFTPLAGVREELDAIRRRIGGTHTLMDDAFTTNALAEALARNRHQWIHIASHAYFGGDASQTFLVAGKDQRVTMDALEQMILPRMVSSKPIELLVLSACETAAGDDQAAFGLAGLAVKSGVRTAIASLWQVNDQSTRELMTVLYEEFQSNPGATRAQVLRSAQKRLIRQPRFHDPYHWSPFILVGQWGDAADGSNRSKADRLP